jgi:hypothetical protein
MLAVDDTSGKVLHVSRDHFSGEGWPQILFRNFVGPTSAVAMRAELFRRVHGFDPRLSALQDYDLWLRLCMAEPVLYDGGHNLRFSAISQTGGRISSDYESYRTGFGYLRAKYRGEIRRLTFWQRRRFDAQARLIAASKYLTRRSYAAAVLQVAVACSLYPPTLLRLSQAALRIAPPSIEIAATANCPLLNDRRRRSRRWWWWWWWWSKRRCLRRQFRALVKHTSPPEFLLVWLLIIPPRFEPALTKLRSVRIHRPKWCRLRGWRVHFVRH